MGFGKVWKRFHKKYFSFLDEENQRQLISFLPRHQEYVKEIAELVHDGKIDEALDKVTEAYLYTLDFLEFIGPLVKMNANKNTLNIYKEFLKIYKRTMDTNIGLAQRFINENNIDTAATFTMLAANTLGYSLFFYLGLIAGRTTYLS